MYKMIEKYMNNLTKENFNILATKNNIIFSEDELDFSYKFVKKNWITFLTNKESFNIDKYKNKFSEDNFMKIKKLYRDSLIKYSRYL